MVDTTSSSKPKRKGNYKPGPGRPPGRKNNETLALEEAARQAAASIDEAFEGDAHAFLQAVYRNPDVPLEIRIMAAGRALRVEKPGPLGKGIRPHATNGQGLTLHPNRSRTRSDSRVAQRMQQCTGSLFFFRGAFTPALCVMPWFNAAARSGWESERGL